MNKEEAVKEATEYLKHGDSPKNEKVVNDVSPYSLPPAVQSTENSKLLLLLL